MTHIKKYKHYFILYSKLIPTTTGEYTSKKNSQEKQVLMES